MKKTRLFFIGVVLTLALVAIPLFGALAQDTNPPSYGVTPTELDAMAIDPQSWKLQDAMTWQEDFTPNPAVNWLEDNHGVKPTRKLRGLLVLVEYYDQPWITGRALGSEIMGNPRSGPDKGEAIQDFWLKYLNEPGEWNNNISVQEYWFENSYGAWDVTLDVAGPIQLPYFEFTYGHYSASTHTGNAHSGQVGRFGNVFPARRTTGTDAMTLINQMPELQFFDPITGDEIYDFMYYHHSGYAQSNTWQEFGEMMFADKSSIVWRDDAGKIQFAENLKNPYTNEPLTTISPITGEQVTGLDFTGWARLDSIERAITAPGFDIVRDWPNFYMVDIEGRWRTQVCTGTAYNTAYTAYQAANPVAAAFNAWRTPRTTATQANYQTNVYLPAFQRIYAQGLKYINANGNINDPNNWTAAWKAYLEDNTSAKITDRLLDMIHQGKTYAENHPTNPYMAYAISRYGSDPWSSWYGAVPVWSSGGASTTCWKAGRSVSFSTQGESNGLGTYIHEFGHIIGVPDNYADSFLDNPRRQPVGVWDLMGSGSMGGPGGGHSRWMIPPALGASTPPNQVFRGKFLGGFHGAANSAERNASVLQVNYADLNNRLVFGEVFARNIPTNKGILDTTGKAIDGLRGIRIMNMTNAGPRLTIANTLLPGSDPYGFRRINPLYWNFGSSSSVAFTNYTMEVVQRTGYDSFVSDSGVMISLNGADTASLSTDSTFPVDAHAGDKKIADYRNPISGAYTPVPDGHPEQLATILFHAGVHNNPSYYRDIGEATRRFAPEDNRPGIAGDVKNEYVDTYNKLHFYILNNNYTPGNHGEILSYDVAVRRTDAAYSSNGSLQLAPLGNPVLAAKDNFVVQKYSLTNTGTSTDIVRVTLSGALTANIGLGFTKEQNAVVLNNLYAIGAGETIEFDVYIKNTQGSLGSNTSELLTIEASSETNSAKKATVSGPNLVVGGDLNVKLDAVKKEAPRNVAVAEFSITNTGDATDIIRVNADGYLPAVVLQELYAIGAGETITVPVYVDLPADIRTRDLSGKIITLTASSETNGVKAGKASVKVEELIAYSFDVYMKPSKTELFVGESLTVDVMLQGDINYTQFAAEIAFDAGLLEYTGYVNLQGWAASVTKPSASIVAVRSVPGMNMIAGSPCTAETKIVTLKFTVKNTFAGAQANTALSFASILVSPAGGVTGSGTAPGQEVPLEFTRVGDASFQQNLALYPGLYSMATGTTMAVFQYGTTNIMEEVYVECPLDTDFDGKRDLIRVTIRRPMESNLPGVRVPVLMEQSPYRDGTFDPGYPPVTGELKTNADTSHYTYENDIKSIKPRASEWPWGDAENTALNIPASRGDKPLGATTKLSAIGGYGASSIFNFLVPRGYAIISSNSIGNAYSDGYTSCGDADETVACMAVINWLNGKCRAYTNQNCTNEVIATDWCNGNVAMSGVSYNGTLPIAVACSGVEGLKAIIPASAISSWYDYYRENGCVLAPTACQGEDANILSIYCNSRVANLTTANSVPSHVAYINNVPNLLGVGLRTAFNNKMTQMVIDQDRDSGDYSRFWDDRNYLATADKVTAGIIVTHGLNDWNVKMKQFDQFFRAVKEKTNTPVKLVLHRGAHTGIYTHEAFFRSAHKWLDYYLYGIDNGITTSMPDISIISSQTGQYESFDTWPVPGSTYTKYYLAPDVNDAAGALSLTPPATAQKTVKDSLVSATLANWETRVFGAANLTAASTERVVFVSDITQNVRFSGTVKATLEVASDKPFGFMTVALVEIGTTATRSFGTTTAETIAAHNGVSAISIIRPSSVSTSGTASSYKVTTSGHADVQNPNPAGKTYMDSGATSYIPPYYYQTVATTPGQFYSYTFEFEPNDWEFRAGNKLAVMVYSIDYRYTPTPNTNVPTLTVRFGPGSYIEIPSIGVFNTITLPEPAPEEEITQAEPQLDAEDPVIAVEGFGGIIDE